MLLTLIDLCFGVIEGILAAAIVFGGLGLIVYGILYAVMFMKHFWKGDL